MPILCLEGPSAVGKTATAQALKANHAAVVVPEVNQLFHRPQAESADWYLERQVDRWLMAVEQSQSHHLTILDGDPFQPLWYNWAYDFVGWQALDALEQFYRSRIQANVLSFPDLYILFSTSETELRSRKTNDATRQRRGFEKHLQMIKPQQRYFQAMQSFSPNHVLFCEAESIQANIEFVQQTMSSRLETNGVEAVELFDQLVQWLRANQAGQW